MALWLIISGTVGSPPPETARVEKNKLRLFKQQTELVIEKKPKCDAVRQALYFTAVV